MTDPAWAVRVSALAERQLARLPERVAAAVVEFVLGPLRENPRRVGHPLQREWSDLWSARRGAYRVVHDIDDSTVTITVLRIDHRADVYRTR
jgi:mRNA-degrading endonuclease RelE of RelBE toxin-antitoxin system